MPRNLTSSAFMKPFVILALPGMYLFYKYNQYKQQQQEQSRRKVTERELAHLNHKIDKLLAKLEENEPEMATSQEDECVICVNAKATMQTSPCGHRVVCRKCFVKTIQMAVSQRLLPLRCVICRAKILRLKQSSGHGGLTYSKSWLMPSSASSYSMSAKSWSAGSSKHYWNDKNWVPSSASQYSMNGRNVPNSASMYSMASGSSSLSGMSSVSSATNSSLGSRSSSTASGGRGPPLRQPIGSLRKSQQYSMKMRIQEYNEPRANEDGEKPSRLAPIAEFQRDSRLGKATSSSTRIRCAQKIVTQLEAGPLENEKSWKKTTTTTTSTTTATTTFTSTSFFKSRSSGKEDKKKDKEKEEKRKDKGKQEGRGKSSERDHEKDKKSSEKKGTAKKEVDRKEEGNNKGEKKESKTDKKNNRKDVKAEKMELKRKDAKETKEAKETTEKEKETLL